MACKFSCLLEYSKVNKQKEVVLFHSEDDDEYRVTYKYSKPRDISLTVQWTVSKYVLVTAEIFTSGFTKCLYSLGSIVSGKKSTLRLRDVLRFCTSGDYSVLCLISVIPFAKSKSSVNRVEEKRKDDSKAVEVAHRELQRPPLDKCNILTPGHVQDTVMSNFKTEMKVSKTKELSNASPEKVSIEESELQVLSMDKHGDHVLSDGGGVISETEKKVHEMSSNIFSTKSVPVEGCRLQELSRGIHSVLTSEDIDDNMKLSLVKNEHKSSNDASETSVQELFVEKHDAFTLSDVEGSSEIKKVHKIPPRDVSTKAMESEFQKLSIIKHDVLSPGQEKNSVITDNEIVVHKATKSDDVTTKYLRVTEIDPQCLIVDNYSFKSEDATDGVKSENNTKIRKIQKTMSSSNICIEVIESEMQGIPNSSPNLNMPDRVHDPVISDRDTEVHNTKLSMVFSEKTDIISYTLVQGLCTDSYELMFPNEDDAVVNNKDVNKLMVSNDLSEEAFPVMEKDFYTLSMDLLDLLKSEKMTDAIISNGNMEVKVHKAILNFRFPQFVNDTGDTIENPIDIPDDLLEDVVLFMYVGLVNIKNMKMAHDLYKIAEKYELNDLSRLCSKHMLKLTVDNVLDTLVVVVGTDNSLKVDVLDFILKNFSALKNSERLLDFIKENPNLVLDILSYVIMERTLDNS